jgi:hypothetical protein
MVERHVKEGKTLFFCEVCGSGYLDEAMAQRCQDWCTERRSCSLDIVKNAVTWK